MRRKARLNLWFIAGDGRVGSARLHYGSQLRHTLRFCVPFGISEFDRVGEEQRSDTVGIAGVLDDVAVCDELLERVRDVPTAHGEVAGQPQHLDAPRLVEGQARRLESHVDPPRRMTAGEGRASERVERWVTHGRLLGLAVSTANSFHHRLCA